MFMRIRLSLADEMVVKNRFEAIFPSMIVARMISLEIGHNYAWDFLPYMLSATHDLKILKLRMIQRKDVEGNSLGIVKIHLIT